MRKPLIAGNWKMNTNVSEAKQLAVSMRDRLDKILDVDIVLCPPFISLNPIKEIINSSKIKLGAQNMYFVNHGAYTGEISPGMLQNVCDFVILGHSERRQYFFETDDLVNKKIKASFEANLTPIFCVGESLKENESGQTENVITNQLGKGLLDIKSNNKLVVAYEPVWAIGTGKAATGNQANDIIKLIRNTLTKIWGGNIARDIRILYGGSVSGVNVAEFIGESDVDGALVGGASLKPDEFVDIVKKTSAIKLAAR